jgi:hypothetical protein
MSSKEEDILKLLSDYSKISSKEVRKKLLAYYATLQKPEDWTLGQHLTLMHLLASRFESIVNTNCTIWEETTFMDKVASLVDGLKHTERSVFMTNARNLYYIRNKMVCHNATDKAVAWDDLNEADKANAFKHLWMAEKAVIKTLEKLGFEIPQE